MAIDAEQVFALVESAGRLVGLKELLRAGGLHPGMGPTLKRVLRDLVKEGRLEQDGKRFGVPGRTHVRKSGPAWESRRPGGVRARAGVGEGLKSKGATSRTPAGPRPALPSALVRERRGPGGPRAVLVEGIINHHRDGFAFVRALTGKSEDVFIPPDEAKKALDHDLVLVEVLPQRGGRTLGRIVEVKRRTRRHVIGTYVERQGRAFVEPREVELGVIDVPKTQLARPGDLVKVRLGVGEKLLTGHQHRLVGEVKGSLGAEADHSVEVLSVAFSRGFHDEFPDEVMDEADAFPLELRRTDLAGRRDLRQWPLVTIDGEDARDFDDAIFVEATRKGWRLVVAIADVSHYVAPGSALDAEALHRATSVYLPGRVLPMLPERLSNGLCSLKPDEDRLCMVADLQIDARGEPLASDIYPAVMRSHARCTYTEVHELLGGGDVPRLQHLAPMLEEAHRLAQALTAMRARRGAVEFDLPETRPELGDDGLPVRLVRRERWESHRLVEECMLAANEAVAREFRRHGRVTVNRFHGEPDEDRLSAFLRLLGSYGIAVPRGRIDSRALNQILKGLEGHPEQKALHQLALRSMMQAFYSSEARGHYGLGAPDYLHFTSPIRRYPDLLVHRLLKQWWNGQEVSDAELEELEAMAQHSSERERAAMLVEREVNALYSCLLMKGRVGETFPATVSSLTEQGFFVELDELYVEGLVKGESVHPEFEFDQASYRLTFGNGRVVKVGQACRVMLLSVNVAKKQMDFRVEAFADEGAAGHGPPRRTGWKPPHRRRGHKPENDREERPKKKPAGARQERREDRPTTGPRDEAPFGPPSGKGFDARAVLDRLWRERGGSPLGRPGRSRPADEPSSRDERRGDGRQSGRRARGGRRR